MVGLKPNFPETSSSMSNCFCLTCDRANPLTTKFCTQCGAKLQIQERYRALKVIGQGGFGKTFLSLERSQPRCLIKQFAFEAINPTANSDQTRHKRACLKGSKQRPQ